MANSQSSAEDKRSGRDRRRPFSIDPGMKKELPGLETPKKSLMASLAARLLWAFAGAVLLAGLGVGLDAQQRVKKEVLEESKAWAGLSAARTRDKLAYVVRRTADAAKWRVASAQSENEKAKSAEANVRDLLKEEGGQAAYWITSAGKIEKAWLGAGALAKEENLAGLDWSRGELWAEIKESSADQGLSGLFLSPSAGNLAAAAWAQGVNGAGEKGWLVLEIRADKAASFALLGQKFADKKTVMIVDKKGQAVGSGGQVNDQLTGLGASGFWGQWRESEAKTGRGAPSGEFEVGGKKFLGAAEKLEPSEWVMLAWMPLDSAMAEAWETLWAVLGGACAAAFLMLAASLGLSARHAKSFRGIAALVKALSEGSRPSWPKAESKEAQDLLRGVMEMKAALSERERGIEVLNGQLEMKVAHRTAALERANQELAVTVSNLKATQEEFARVSRMAQAGGMAVSLIKDMGGPLTQARSASMVLAQLGETIKSQARSGGELKTPQLEELGRKLSVLEAAMADALGSATGVLGDVEAASASASAEKIEEFDLWDETDKAIAFFAKRLDEKKIQVRRRFSPMKALNHPGAFNHIMCNILANALEHGFGGRPTGVLGIKIEAHPQGEGWARVVVSDDGPGMSKDVQEKIFSPMFTMKFAGGKGLGLHVALTLAREKLGGALHVKSAMGEGAAFTLDLPLRSADALDAKN